MRRALVILGIVGSVFANAIPASAVGPMEPGLSFTRQPIGGPPGTHITVTGTCRNGATGTASLVRPSYSDFFVVGDSQQFTVDSDHRFTAQLTNSFGHFQFPTDAEVRVSCGGESLVRPFEGGDSVAASDAAVFTALGSGPCGHVATPDGRDGEVPCHSHVKGFRANGAIADANFYIGTWQWGASIAVADLNRDGHLDVVHGTGSHSVAGFGVSNLAGDPIYQGVATYPGFDGGVMVAAGDVNGDGAFDIVTGAGPGGGPHVKVFTLDTTGPTAGVGFHEIAGFMAYAPNFTGGVSIAVGDVDGDGRDEIVTGAGPGGGPHVRVFDGVGGARGGWYAYDPGFAGGVTVASANLFGDARDEIVTGAGAGGGPHVRVFNGNGSFTSTGFMAYWPEMQNGVYVAAGMISGQPRIVTGPGAGADPHVKIFAPDGTQAGEELKEAGFMAFGGFKAGVRVAVAP